MNDDSAEAVTLTDHPRKVGVRISLDAHGCAPTHCYEEHTLSTLVGSIAHGVGANVLKIVAQTFPGGAKTIVAILSTSHCVIHSWPELRFITIDLFVCASEVEVSTIVELVNDSLEPHRVEVYKSAAETNLAKG